MPRVFNRQLNQPVVPSFPIAWLVMYTLGSHRRQTVDYPRGAAGCFGGLPEIGYNQSVTTSATIRTQQVALRTLMVNFNCLSLRNRPLVHIK